MIKKILFFTIFAVSLFFLGTYIQKFNTTSKADMQKTIQAKEEEKLQKEQESLIDIGEFSDGAKLYRDELQQDCKMSGFSLARKKTKSQWEEIAKNGKLAETIATFCPNVKFNNIWTPDIYEFLHKNAVASKS